MILSWSDALTEGLLGCTNSPNLTVEISFCALVLELERLGCGYPTIATLLKDVASFPSPLWENL